MIELPIDLFVPQIVDDVRRARAVVVTAAPGAGKTTRVPPALMADGPVIVLQPRRVAARAIAGRIAAERGWTVGREAGWQIRLDRNFTAATRLLVVTEGILTARLQSDPLLTDFQTIVLDEFHERSIHADVAIALAKQAWRARADLRIVVMSATLDSAAVSAFLDGCPVVEVPGRTHPVDITYTAGQSVADAVIDVLGAPGRSASLQASGNVLCFLPGAREIDRAVGEIRGRVDATMDVLPLHGSLDADAQDAALSPSSRRRVIVATNIAETSVTVPGVTAVVDGGLQKVARYDAQRGIDTLETERITADAADQRAGRAGRVAPGTVRRLWDARDRLRPHREPDIHRVDLSSAVLDVIAWGGDPRTLEWFEMPRVEAIDAALALLERLGLVAGGKLTPIGAEARRLPMHPRLARVVIEGRGSRALAVACERLAERRQPRSSSTTTSSDVLTLIDDVRLDIDETAFRRAIFAGYSDRVAKRREPRSKEVLLSTGTGATIGRESGVLDGEYLVAVEVRQLPVAGRQSEAFIRIASRIEREWLTPTSSGVEHRFDAAKGAVRAAIVERYDALILAESPTKPDPEVAAGRLADAWLSQSPRDEDARLLRRLRFAGREIDLGALARAAAYGARSLADLRIETALAPDVVRSLDRDAPESLVVPSGRHKPIEYNEDGTVSVSVKLQELFGLAETPRIGPRREPIVLSLLAPNGRPVQVTRDLRSFWDRTYPEVRKELRGRYPKHPWPEDPWKASPSARPKRKFEV